MVASPASSAWLLSRRHRVTLFEAGDYVGAYTNTIDIEVEGHRHPIDTGFLVFNDRTYPNLCALFARLGVASVESEMSFGVSLAEPEIEWAGSDLGTVFAQPANLLRPAFLGMLADILRFNRETTRMAATGDAPAISLGDYLAAGRYGRAFRDWYLLPMAAAIWSCPTRTMLDYPLATFARFCHNHGLLQIFDRPRWRTVAGGGASTCGACWPSSTTYRWPPRCWASSAWPTAGALPRRRRALRRGGVRLPQRPDPGDPRRGGQQ